MSRLGGSDTLRGMTLTQRSAPVPASSPTAGDTSPPSAAERPHSALAAWSVRHRWLVVVLAAIVVALGGYAFSTGIVTTDAGEQDVGESSTADAAIDAAPWADDGVTEQVVVTAPEALGEDQLETLAGELVAHYDGVEHVATVGEPFPAPDGASMVLPLTLEADEDEGTVLPDPADAVGPSLDATEGFAADHPDLQVGQVGDASIDADLNESIESDFRRAEFISLPVTLLVLLLAFGAVVAAGVPLVLGLGSVVVAFGITALVSQQVIPVDANTQALVLLIGLAVGVDYALFVLRRAREERRAGADIRTAIVTASATSGRAVVVSGLTVVVAMSGMLVAGGLFTSLAVGAMTVVAVAVAAVAVVLPAILAILGDKVDAIRLPGTRARAARAGSPDSPWGRIAGAVTRRPAIAAVVSAAALAGLAIPAAGMHTSLGGVEAFDPELPSVQAYQQLQQAVPTDGTTLELVVEHEPEAADAVAEALLGASEQATALPRVTGVGADVETSLDATVTTWSVATDLAMSDTDLGDLVAEVRAELAPQIEADLPAGQQVWVSGAAAVTDLSQWMDSRLPWVVGFVLVLTLVVMALSFGSPWLAAATVALNVLSVGAAYGVLTLVFSGDWAEGLLDFHSTGAIASWLPLLMFVILFGLSMDYHIFVTSRVREAWDSTPGMPSRERVRHAVRAGVARSAGVVTAAAAVMVAVFAIFGTLSQLEMKQLGVGLATAVLLDATVVRGVLLPATLTLLGERAHTGPSWLPRLHH